MTVYCFFYFRQGLIFCFFLFHYVENFNYKNIKIILYYLFSTVTIGNSEIHCQQKFKTE